MLLARDEVSLGRLLALEIVADTDPDSIDAGALADIRSALLEEDWSTAVSVWIEATGIRVDVHPDESVVDEFSPEAAAFDIRLSRVFAS